MQVQLLLLLALVGPFCAFTYASPTALPTDLEGVTDVPGTQVVPEATVDLKDETVITGAPSAGPEVAPEDIMTQATTDEVPAATEAAAAATQGTAVNTDAPPAVDTEAPPANPEPAATDAPVVETAPPVVTEETKSEQPGAAEQGGEVIIEDGEGGEGLTSGQVVGIVIGALVAVIIVIAVVIAVVRRMGKYSP